MASVPRFVLVTALLAALVSLPTGVTADAPNESDVGPGSCVDSVILGTSAATPPVPREIAVDRLSKNYRSYWSGDRDYRLSNRVGSALTNQTKLNKAAACSTDISWSRPPDVSPWVSAAHPSFSGGDRGQTVYPEGTSLSSGAYIKDAYVRIFSVTPSTNVQADDGNQLFINSNGTVRAIIDYRVRTREDDTTGSTRRFYSDNDARVEKVELLVDGEVVDSAEPGSKHPTLDYARQSTASELTVRAVINSSWGVESYTCFGNWTDDGTTCSGRYETSVGTQSHSYTVSTTRNVTVSDPQITGERATFQGNDSGAYVKIDQPWRSISLGPSGEATVQGRWRFYTRTPTDFTSFYQTDGSTRTSRSIPVRALQVYAIPATREAQINQSDGRRLTLTHQFGSIRPVRSPPDRVQISNASETRDLDGIEVRSNHDAAFYRNVEVSGMVRGADSDGHLASHTTVRRPNVSVEATDRTNQQTTLRISAGLDGRPVENGTIELRNTTATLADPGETTITLEGTGSRIFQATYRPAERWWAASTPLMKTSQTVVIQPATPTFKWVIDFIALTILWFLPLGILLLALDYMANGKLINVANRT